MHTCRPRSNERASRHGWLAAATLNAWWSCSTAAPPWARGSPPRACYLAAMSDEQLRDRRVATLADPQLRDYKVVGGLDTFANRSFWPNFFSKLVARLQWNPEAIDLTPDAREFPRLPDERRRRLKTLLAGFRIGDDLVSEHIAPFADAARQGTLTSQESLMAWVFFLQRRDEQRHAVLFDRIAAEVLGLPGATPAERRAAARAEAPPAMLDDLADGALPGVYEGVRRVELDERWHIGFGLRCLIETQPSRELLEDLLARAEEAAEVWGDAVPAAMRRECAQKVAHRLHVSRLIETPAAAA